MELTIENVEIERDCIYVQSKPFAIRESSSMDYASAAVLLRNLGERKDTTSLERDALSAAIRLMQRNIDAKKS